MRRVIKQRALNVHLNPALEENCRQDLGLLCSGDDIDDNSVSMCCTDTCYFGVTLVHVARIACCYCTTFIFDLSICFN